VDADRAAFGRMTETPGRWVAEESWPSPRIREERRFLNPDSRLSARQETEAPVVLEPLQTVGLSSGNWCPSGGTSPEDLKIEMAQDQRLDDARSLTFDSEPLAANVEMLGSARVTLELAVDRPVALVAVRLNEVAPSGESNRVTYGLLNLTHRDSHENPTALEPGRRYRVEVPLDNAAHVFSAGSRIRVSVSTAYWPLVMPSPEPVTLTVFAGPSALALPVRPARGEDAALAPFEPPFVPEVGARSLGGHPGERIVEWDVARRTQTIRNMGARERALILATNTEIASTTDITYRISDDDPTSAVIDYHCTLATLREDWKPHVDSKARVSMTREEIVLTGELNAFLGDERILTRRWDRRIPRYLV
jgi:hypothetical protein